MHPNFDSYPKKSDKDGKTLFRTHLRVCFASTIERYEIRQGLFSYLYLGAYLSALKVRGD